MSSQFPLITTVKTAMPEVNPASFITAPESSSWLGRMVQPIKNHPILFAVTAVVIGIIGYVGYNIYKAFSSNGSNASTGGDEDLKTPHIPNASTGGHQDLIIKKPETEKERYYNTMKEFADKRKSLQSQIATLLEEKSGTYETVKSNTSLRLNNEYFYKTYENLVNQIDKLKLQLNELSQNEKSFEDSNAHIMTS